MRQEKTNGKPSCSHPWGSWWGELNTEVLKSAKVSEAGERDREKIQLVVIERWSKTETS